MGMKVVKQKLVIKNKMEPHNDLQGIAVFNVKSKMGKQGLIQKMFVGGSR